MWNNYVRFTKTRIVKEAEKTKMQHGSDDGDIEFTSMNDVLIPQTTFEATNDDLSTSSATSLPPNEHAEHCYEETVSMVDVYSDSSHPQEKENECVTENAVLSYVPTQLESMMYELAKDLNYTMCRSST